MLAKNFGVPTSAFAVIPEDIEHVDEWPYYISGQGRMTVFAASGNARTLDYQAGDVGYLPFAMGHYIENTVAETLLSLEMFLGDRFADVSPNQCIARPLPSWYE